MRTAPGGWGRRHGRTAVSALLAVALSLFVPAPAQAGGGAAPEIQLQDGLNGVSATTRLSGLKGKPVILVFWIPICPHCPIMAARAHRLHQHYASKGLQVISITHGKKRYVSQWLQQQGYNYGVGFDWSGVTAARYGVKMLPALFLIGKNGTQVPYGNNIEAAIERELR
jgi:peroxiredoxin